MITANDIQPNAKFKIESGTVFIIDKVDTTNNLVETSLEGGKKGNYRDHLDEVVAFLNEEKAQKI